MEGMQEESGGFMELLESDDLLGLGRDDGLERGEEERGFPFFGRPASTTCSSSSPAASQMLCFGAGAGGGGVAVLAAQKSSDRDSSLSTLSSSPSSTSSITAATTTSSKPSSRKAGGGRRSSTTGGGAATAVGASKKKLKTEAPSSAQPGTIRVRKEKLGERITALQQLVSPFGKSDTASVLHEALGYIRFLHEQVQVLSSPYLQHLPASAHLHDGGQGGGCGGGGGSGGGDLRSRGLCLVPVACTERVASSNGADLWTPSPSPRP